MRKRHITIIILFPELIIIWLYGPGTGIASKFGEMKYETAFNRTKKFDWSGKKYLFTVMENVVQFAHSTGNPLFQLQLQR